MKLHLLSRGHRTAISVSGAEGLALPMWVSTSAWFGYTEMLPLGENPYLTGHSKVEELFHM